MEFEFNTKFINDDEGLSDRNINIIVQDNNKNEVKILINKNKTIKQLGLAYLEKSSLDKSLISKLLFYFDGQKLDNCQTLKEIDIENQDIIDLKINK
ncbi:hypothetical protein BCR36DRAFT_284128 [Piromyces finnis]|uniref:Ubiquitin-like domain-containing protein n=1 Tax=Piromyces finnis TaxID=1754191 RepID=A0A1Y1VEY9_9FUNG|nr:hypothetical protein BCR36DRAFT_284128 [Piromyces finnis]|eukprot:ORX53762.1 hypothetical protein BCR36DRAFT_284128 [Piromyces finnis]